MVTAEVHSDSHRWTANFDVTPWFVQADDKDIIELAEIGWGGDYAADAVARFCEDLNKDVAHVLETVRELDDEGFECHVHKEQALEWIKANRPAIMEHIGE